MNIETQTHHPRRLGRSIGALLAGIITGIVLSLGTDFLMQSLNVFPQFGQRMSDAQCLLATAYRAVYGIAGSYIIARLAPDRPMQHALLSGVIGLVVCVVGAIVTWDAMPPLGPRWYALALIVTALPCAWVGAKLYEVQQSR